MIRFETFRRLAVLAALMSAWMAAQGAQLVVAQSVPLSGLDANQGRAYSAGMQLWFNTVNRAGGVNGHTFSLVRKDDGGRPEETIAATRQLLAEHRPVVLAGFFGTRNIADLVASGLLDAEKIALVGYRVAEIRPETPQLYGIRAGLQEEINKVADHLATIGITRLGLVYEDGSGAAALLAAAEEAAARTKVQLAAKATYPAGTARMAPAVAAMIQASPQAVLMITSGAAAAGFIEQYRAAGGVAQLFAHSGADIEQLSKRLGDEQMQGVAIAQVTPSPYRVSTRLAKELTDIVAATKDLDVPVSYAMMEGFIAAKVIVEAVRRQGGKITREGMSAALDAMASYDLGGYLISYRPGKHSGSRLVELSIISGAGRIRQ